MKNVHPQIAVPSLLAAPGKGIHEAKVLLWKNEGRGHHGKLLLQETPDLIVTGGRVARKLSNYGQR